MGANADIDLFAATVPVFADFAPRIVGLAEAAERDGVPLDTRLVPGTFGAAEHLVVAQGFIVRTIHPVIDRGVPGLGTEAPTLAGIRRRHAVVAAVLDGLFASDFAGAAAREISHVAGDAELTQGAVDYVRMFGVPNFFFHLTMGYASLRAAGVDVGKAGFDGLHRYAPGFSFDH